MSERKRAKCLHAPCFSCRHKFLFDYGLHESFFLVIKFSCHWIVLLVNFTNGFVSVIVLRKAFESFDSTKSGSISTETVAEILRLMGQPFNRQILEEMIEEVDEDKSGRLEFEEFIILAAKFIVEEDEEARKIDLISTCNSNF